MINFPLYFLVIGYIVFLGVFAFFFITNLLHLIATGTFTPASMLVTAILIVATLGVLEVTWELTSSIDLRQPAAIWDQKVLGGAVEGGLFK
jgi:hypothetical protein